MGRSRGAEGPISVQKLKEDRPSWQKRNGYLLKEGCLKSKGGRREISEGWILLKHYSNLYCVPSTLITALSSSPLHT